MADSIFKKIGTLIGVENACFAKITKDDATGTEYETDIQEAPGLIEIALTANVTNEALGADNITLYDIINGLDGFDVSVTMASMGEAGTAYLLGNKIDSNGVRLENAGDVAPYLAMGFKTLRSDGSYDYIWLLKGKFAPSDQTFRTKEKGKVNWQTPTMTASFAPRISDKNIRAIVNDQETKAAAIIGGFFKSVYTPTLGEAAAAAETGENGEPAADPETT